MRIMGIDPSTKTAYAITEGEETLFTEQIHTDKNESDLVRGVRTAAFIEKAIQEHKPDMIIIEGYSLNSKFNLATMVTIGTCIRNRLYEVGINWYDAPPKTLKLWLTGKGTATKKDMIAHVKRRFAFVTKNDDIADAVALSHYGQAMFVFETASYESEFLVKFEISENSI